MILQPHIPARRSDPSAFTGFACFPSSALACFGGGGGGGSSSSTSTENTDKRITASEGDVFALQDTQVEVAPGGTVSIITNDPKAALAAIESVERQGNRLSAVVQNLGEQANESAQLVTNAQANIAEIASGQKSFMTALTLTGIVVGVIAIPKLFDKTK